MLTRARTGLVFAFLAVAFSAAAQAAPAASRRVELGLDGGAVFGLGDRSSVSITVPGSRFRIGFFSPASHFSIEPAAGFSYDKVKDTDGVFTYTLELGALYHFGPGLIPVTESGVTTARQTTPYLRPFLGLDGFSGGSTSDNEFSLGMGLGTKTMWRHDIALRFEGNVGYGFSNKATRLGLLAGISYFPR
jgi:hypothetical protein